MKNLELKTRLALGFCLVMALMSAVGIFALIQLKLLSDTNKNIYQHPFAVSNAVLRVSANIAKIHGAMKGVPLADTQAEIEAIKQQISRYEKEVLADFDIIAERFLGKPEMHQRAKTLFLAWRPIRETIMDLVLAGQKKQAIQLESMTCLPRVKKLTQAVAELNDFAQNKAKYFHAVAEESANRSLIWVASLLTLAILLCLTLMVFVTRKVVSIVEMDQNHSRLGAFESTISQLDDTAFWIDSKGRIIYANQSASRHTGFSGEYLLAMSLWDVDAGLAKDAWAQYWMEAQAAEHVHLETNYRRKNGETFPVDLSQIYYQHEKQPFISLIARDITERKRAEKALKESEELLDATGRMARVGGWELDGRTMEVSWTSETCRIYEVPIGRKPSLEEAINFFHPDERERLRNAIQEAFEQGTPYDMELRFITATGRQRWTRMICHPQKSDGGVVSLLGTFQDITDIKKKEDAIKLHQEMLVSLFEASPVWISVTRVDDGTFIQINEAAVRNIGYTRNELIGNSALDLGIWPERQERDEPKRLLLEKGRFRDQEVQFRTKSGEIRDYLWNAEVIELDGEKCSINVVQDITEYKLARNKLERFNVELEKRVARRTAELAAANKELEAFAYSVSHDLRAPLRAISGFSQAVLEDYYDKLDEEGQDYLRRIRDAGNNLGQLIDDILKLSRITRADMNYIDVDLSNIASEVVNTLMQEEPERNAEIIIQPGLKAQGDETLLKVLLDNMLRNAWKFTSKRTLTKIEFGLSERLTKGSNGDRPSNVYFLWDNGVGFDPRYQNKLFQPFQRLHRQNEFPGTGIGLATVQRVVTRHGGEVWAESQVGLGATFYFTLGSEQS